MEGKSVAGRIHGHHRVGQAVELPGQSGAVAIRSGPGSGAVVATAKSKAQSCGQKKDESHYLEYTGRPGRRRAAGPG